VSPERPTLSGVRHLPALLSAGLLTTVVSETMFWGSFERAYHLPDVLLMGVPYVVAVVVAVFALERLAPPGADGLLLAGALVGWLVEGVVVATTYEALPVSIAVTALSWHALLSVLATWWLLPRLLRRPMPSRLAGVAAIGAVWGLWGAFMARDGHVTPTPSDVVAYVVLTTLWLAAATWAWDRRPAGPLVPAAAGWTATGLLAAGFVVRAVTLPVAAVVLPPLVALTVLAMRRLGRRGDGAPLATAPPDRRLRAGELAALAVLPVVAASASLTVGPAVAPVTGPAVYAVTGLAGFGLWLRALVRSTRR
jgi:hypothetical protein